MKARFIDMAPYKQVRSGRRMNVNYYSKEDFKKGIKNPSLALEELISLYEKKIKFPISKLLFDKKHQGGIDIIAEDWDTLIILDALRYDVCADVNPLDGELSSVISQASTSEGFVRANFDGRELYDTIYVTANGWNEKLNRDPFFLTKKSYANFDDRYSFYDPENIYDMSIESFNNYPNKRMIIHFMQPHVPYIGPKADKLRERVTENHGYEFEHIKEFNGERIVDDDYLLNLMEAAKKGYISDRELREVYIENLQQVIPYVEKIVDQFSGKTVVTADHGEFLGDSMGAFGRHLYGHPAGVGMLPVREVPWLEFEYKERRNIRSQKPIESASVSDRNVEASLRALGYKE